MPKKLRVDVVEGHQVSTKRPEVFDVILLIPGVAPSPDVVIMVEPILHAEAGRTLHETAVKRAQHIRRHLGLANCYSVSDGNRKLFDVWADDITEAILLIGQEHQAKLPDICHQLRIDLVEGAR